MRAGRENAKPSFIRRAVACLVSAAMVVAFTPVVAWGAEGDVTYLYCDENGTNWQTGTKQVGEYTEVTDAYLSSTSYKLTGGQNGSWYVVPKDTKINLSNKVVTIEGNVHLILADRCHLNLNDTNGSVRLEDDDDDPNTPSTNSLTIYAQSTAQSTMGKLTATGTGISGGNGNNGGTVTINGGIVEARDNGTGAAIGGGVRGSGGTVTINGGVVTAIANGYDGTGAAIGGGVGGSGGTVTINGGSVTAVCMRGGAGIGGGSSGSSGSIPSGAGGTVTITGGTVIATSKYGAGIGGGYGASDDGTFSTGSDGKAVVFASSIPDKTSQGSWRGVIFEDISGSWSYPNLTVSGGNGAIYGLSAAPSESFALLSGSELKIPKNSTLNIAEGKTLTIANGSKLTVEAADPTENSGMIVNKGTITNKGTLDNQGAIKNIVTLMGGGKVIGTMSYNYDASGGTTTSLPTSVPGYTITNWYNDSSLTSGPVTSINNNGLTAMTFYTTCTANTYYVTLNANGGTINSGNVTSYTYGQGATLPTDVTKSGYTFAGWYDSNNQKVTEIAADSTGDVSLTAKWTANYVPPATPQAATDCIKAIGALPDVDVLTLEDGPAIQAARSAYEALTDYQKSFVPAASMEKLEAAEQRYGDLVAVAPVEAALGTLVDADKLKTSQAKAAVKKAQAALEEYASLTDGQKALVDEALIANAQEVVVKGSILIAKADKKAVGKVKNKAFSVKYGTSKFIYFKTLASAAGTKVTYKKASGSKYITVGKAGKVTAKKGMREGKTYTAKLKVTCGKSWKYVKVVVRAQR